MSWVKTSEQKPEADEIVNVFPVSLEVSDNGVGIALYTENYDFPYDYWCSFTPPAPPQFDEQGELKQ